MQQIIIKIRSFLMCILFAASFMLAGAQPAFTGLKEKSNAAQTLQYLNSFKNLPQSIYWPHVPPDMLLKNLKTFTIEPFAFYEGKATNFCAYSALTYIPLKYDPLGFAKFMISLYQNGQALMGKDVIKPTRPVRNEAGLMKYKGSLDINVAGQMWFLSLADHYKGYINWFNQNYSPGDENSFWASTNYAKFNRMLRRLFLLRLDAKGADLWRPRIKDLYAYLNTKMQQGLVFVYLNNKLLYKKTHTRGLIKTPTHYVLLTKIEKKENGDIEFQYWDYGLKTLRILSPAFVKKIIYGVTTCESQKNIHAR